MHLTTQQPAMPTKKTYRVWAMKVEAMLDGQDLLDLVLGQAGHRSETTTDLKRKQRKAYNLIIAQLDDANLGLLDESISSEQCPQRLWHKIKEMYGEMSSAERKKAWMTFYACPSNADLGSLIAHFRRTAPFLTLMGADEAPANEAAAAFVLSKLPQSLSTLRDTLCKDESSSTVERLLEKLEVEMRPRQPVKLEPNEIVPAQPMYYSKDDQRLSCRSPNIRRLEASEAVFVETVTACEAPCRTRAQPQLIAQVDQYCAIGKPSNLQPASYSVTTDERPRSVRETQKTDLLAIAVSRGASLDIGSKSGLSIAPKYSGSASAIPTQSSELSTSLTKSAVHVLPTPKKPLPRFAGSVTMDVLRHEIQRRYPRILIKWDTRKPAIAALYEDLSVKGPTKQLINNLSRYNSALIDNDYLGMLKMKLKMNKRMLKDDYRALIQIKRPNTPMPYLIKLPELASLYEECFWV